MTPLGAMVGHRRGVLTFPDPYRIRWHVTSTSAPHLRPRFPRAALLAILALASSACSFDSDAEAASTISGTEPASAGELVGDGKDIFRHATFGNEVFWTDTLRLHEVIQTKVDPTTALLVG